MHQQHKHKRIIMASPTIIASKNGRQRKFSTYEWTLLGKNKEGWVEVTGQTVTNNTKIIAPPTGEKKIVVSNGVNNTNEETKVSNDVKDEKTITVKNGEEIKKEKRDEFMLAIEGLSKSSIKNFFDKKNIEYDNKNAEGLKTLLANHFNYDLVAYQKEFSV